MVWGKLCAAVGCYGNLSPTCLDLSPRSFQPHAFAYDVNSIVHSAFPQKTAHVSVCTSYSRPPAFPGIRCTTEDATRSRQHGEQKKATKLMRTPPANSSPSRSLHKTILAQEP